MTTLMPGDWKPIVSALIQPPASLLLLIALALLATWRRPKAWAMALIAIGSAMLWLMCCTATAIWLQDRWLQPPAALSAAQVHSLRSRSNQLSTAIVVLGSGRIASAAEYGGQSLLTPQGMVRLRYGVWLARQTGLPLAYSGGVGWAQGQGPTEAETAARIVGEDAGLTLRWLESQSRDTRENASQTVSLLRTAQVQRIVLVTHASHMPRALRAFRQAAGAEIECMAAPVAFAETEDRPALNWLPTSQGFQAVHAILHEMIGLLAGA